LIGVTEMIISGSGEFAGVGIAIPVDDVNRVTAQLIRDGHVPIPGRQVDITLADVSRNQG
jgi:2-alkenal reductase